MRITRNDILSYLEEHGADDERRGRAEEALPALVETKDYEDTLRELGVDIDELISRQDQQGIPGPTPDGINPEKEGPVPAPNTAGGS
ncbi:MAG TPA: hypothetical protein VM324_04510 [Egibacteraceae bacterium]|jgi:hypothetical protein|nr:hypothetical protein [Egibacteraceae bacterium]